MSFRFACAILLSLFALQAVAVRVSFGEAVPLPAQAENLAGRWQVRFAFLSIGEKKLVLSVQAKGSGSFLLLDTGPDNKPVPDPLPAVWSQTTNDRVNFSGEVELPFGTCCRETGTLILKGKFSSHNSIVGKAIFVATTQDEESPYGFRSMVGTFTATRMPSDK